MCKLKLPQKASLKKGEVQLYILTLQEIWHANVKKKEKKSKYD